MSHTLGTDHEVDYGYGDAKPASRGRALSGMGDEISVMSRDRSRSQSRGRSIPRRMSIKTPTRSKKGIVMDPLAMSPGGNKTLNKFFNNESSTSLNSVGSSAAGHCASGSAGLNFEDDLSVVEDEAMMLRDSTQIETNDSHDRQRPHSHRGTKESGNGRNRSENKMRNHHKSSHSNKIESSDTKSSERSHKDRHHSNCKSPQKSRSRGQVQGDSDREKSPHGNKHNKHGFSSSNRSDEEERRNGVKKSTSSDALKSEKHRGTKTSSKLRAPSHSPKAKKKAVRRESNNTNSEKEQKQRKKDHSDSDSSGSSDSDSDDSSSSDDSQDDKHMQGGKVGSVMQFDPLAAGGTVKVGQKEGKNGISEFSDPVGDAQRLQGHKKKPVFSFLDGECSSDDEFNKESKKTKQRGVAKHKSSSPKLSSREKPSASSSSTRKKSERTSSKNEKYAEKETEKQPEKKFDVTLMSMSGFNSTTCHFCHKDVGPMIMQCMSCKEMYFCQKCLRKGVVGPHQQECAQRKVEQREQRADAARQRVSKARSMPDLDLGPPASEITKRRKPKKSASATDTPLITKDSESLFDKQPLLVKQSDDNGDEEDDPDNPSKSPRKKLGIGKFFGGLGKKKKNDDDDNNKKNEGPVDDDDESSVTGIARKASLFRRQPSRTHHALMDDDSNGSM